MVRRKLTFQFSAAQFLFWAGICSAQTYATVFFLEMGLSDQQVGFVLATGNIAGVMLQPWISQTGLRLAGGQLRTAAAFASGMSAVALLFMRAAFHAPLFAAAAFAITVAMLSSLQAFLNAAGMEYKNSGYILDFGIGRGIGSAGYAGMSCIMGEAAAKMGPRLIPLIAAGVMGGLGLVMRTFPKTRNDNVTVPEHREGAFTLLRKNPGFAWMLCGCTILFSCYNAYNAYLIQIVTAMGAHIDTMGRIAALGAILEVPAMMCMTWLKKYFSSRSLFLFSTVMLSIKFGNIVLLGTIQGVYLSQLLQPFSYAILIPATVLYVDETLGGGSATMGQVLLVETNTLGNVLGSICGGFLLEHGGVPCMLLVITVGSVLGSIISFAAAIDRSAKGTGKNRNRAKSGK